MRQDVLKTVMRKFMDEYPGYISFCWHGGEPLLAGKKFFREVVRVQREFRKEGQEVENRLQTNGTLIDREWAEKCQEWCKKYKSCNLEIMEHAIKK